MGTFLISLLAFALVILVCVGFHELGHFLGAKFCGIRVDEFAIGFGPTMVSKTKGETKYSLRWLPFGGYVRMAGMLGLEGEADAGERNFNRASIPKRILVMGLGVAFNFILALVFLTVATMLPQGSSVISGGPSAKAGLHAGDSLLAINGAPIDHSSVLTANQSTVTAVSDTNGLPAQVTYRNSLGQVEPATLKPQLGIYNQVANNPNCNPHLIPEGSSYITAIDNHPVATGSPATLLQNATTVSGVSLGAPDNQICPSTVFNDAPWPGLSSNLTASWKIGFILDYSGSSFPTAISGAATAFWEFVPQTVGALQQLGSTPGSGGVLGPNGLQGPVGIAADAGQTVQGGAKQFLAFIGFISLNLGFLNILPIPFLDGGKMALVILEAIRRKRLDPKREAAIYAVGLAILVTFMFIVTFGNLFSH